MTETLKRENDFENTLETLKERGVAFVDVGINEQERSVLDKIDIKNNIGEFNYFGPVDEETLIKKLTEYFSAMGDNNKETVNAISSLVSRIAVKTQNDLQGESAWVCIRTMAKETKEFDIPRWHQDGAYYQSDEEYYKLVFNLKGKPTRFAKATDWAKWEALSLEDALNNQKEIDGEISSDEFNKEETRIRTALMEIVEELDPPNSEQAALYTVNHREKSTIHSEPPIHEPRIFMQVLPGPKEKIEEWERKCQKNT
jgi:hypothetical protein